MDFMVDFGCYYRMVDFAGIIGMVIIIIIIPELFVHLENERVVMET